MNSILIKGIFLNGSVKDILIEGETIAAIGDNISVNENSSCKIIDGRGKTAIAGFVNMHTHSAMTLFRGFNEDSKLMDWLQDVWRIEPKLDDELIYWGTKLACLEMIKTGTTCFYDQYWLIESAQKAIEEMGLRSVQTYVALDGKDSSKDESLKKEFERVYNVSKTWPQLNSFAVSIHAPYTVCDPMIVWCSNFARENGLKVNIHISETRQENEDSVRINGCSPVEHLNNLGVLGPEVIAAHCVWLSDKDMDILAKNDVKVVHNINSNLKLSSGYRFKYNELKSRGVTVCLGTDGAASSNNLDMREAMKTASLVQKAWREDPTAMPLADLYNMATVNGAKALGINTGVIEVGKLADIAIVDTDNYAFTPNINFLANFVYSANSSCIDTLICNGRIVMENRLVKGEREIVENVNKLYHKLFD